MLRGGNAAIAGRAVNSHSLSRAGLLVVPIGSQLKAPTVRQTDDRSFAYTVNCRIRFLHGVARCLLFWIRRVGEVIDGHLLIYAD